MTCPQRQRLAALGDAILVESAERRAALEHAADCPECRRIAFEIDPTLAVSDLPPVRVTAAEVRGIKHNVLAVRRVQRFDEAARPSGWNRRRWAAVAALTAGILLVAEDESRRAAVDARAEVAGAPLLSEDYRLFGALPLVESLEPSQPRVYQLGEEEDFSLVWIVDESLEISPR